MKKIVTTAFLFAITSIAMAQQEQQVNDDQLQQQAPRETQVRVERAAVREAKKQKIANRKEVRRLKKEVRRGRRDTSAIE